MPDTTIPDALADDLRDLYLSAQPAGLNLDADRVCLKHAKGEPPSPRLVFLMGDPKHQVRMEGTAEIIASMQYITSSDSIEPAAHQLTAGKLDTWIRSIRALKRRGVISSRCYLHEITNMQPITAIRTEQREQVTTLRAKMMVTLVSA